eukprot:GHVT01040999.1.p2 GENE.GHVT01040999.1~~GHVT01040999.1.p2  ORF type:complete len:136 (+),score=14.11 GHVT01040999.1:457-864(+)
MGLRRAMKRNQNELSANCCHWRRLVRAKDRTSQHSDVPVCAISGNLLGYFKAKKQIKSARKVQIGLKRLAAKKPPAFVSYQKQPAYLFVCSFHFPSNSSAVNTFHCDLGFLSSNNMQQAHPTKLNAKDLVRKTGR